MIGRERDVYGLQSSGLHSVKRGVASAQPKQILVRAVLGDAAALDRDDAIGNAHRHEAGGR